MHKILGIINMVSSSVGIYAPVFEEAGIGKLLCTLTKHELPESQIENYVKTKKFLDAWVVHEILNEYGAYFQPIQNGYLTCNLTNRSISKDAKTLKNHVNGARFKRKLDEHKEKEQNDADSNNSNNTNDRMDDSAPAPPETPEAVVGETEVEKPLTGKKRVSNSSGKSETPARKLRRTKQK